MRSSDVVAHHRAAGREFEAAGIQSFVREQGGGDAVLCMHGVPASSFLYRKVIEELARHGLRGVAFDLPGLGLAARPQQFDYSWTGLGKFSIAAVDALGLDRFHLVVHDIGGPVGFEIAAAMPERIRSITVLNTAIEVARFHPVDAAVVGFDEEDGFGGAVCDVGYFGGCRAGPDGSGAGDGDVAGFTW